MAKYYHIEKLRTKRYPCIIFSKSYISPIDEIDQLENDLGKIGIKGKVVFDLLLSNGDTPDRYFEADFDGKQINRSSIKQINTIPIKIKTASISFYKESIHLIENSVLTKQKKFLLKNRRNR